MRRGCRKASRPRSIRTAGAIELVRDRFDDPVPGPKTLRDAANYIQKRPEAEQELPHWRTAVEALIMAAEGKGPLLHARVGMLRAMHHGVERVFNSDRKKTHWGKRKLKRDQ
jgi:hypothetical protein